MFLKIKNVGKIKNVKKRKKRALNKKRKKTFFTSMLLSRHCCKNAVFKNLYEFREQLTTTINSTEN